MKRPALGLLVIVAICLDVLLASALPKKDSSKSASQLSSKETVSKEKLSAAKKPFGKMIELCEFHNLPIIFIPFRLHSIW